MNNIDANHIDALRAEAGGNNDNYLELLKRLPVAVYTLDSSARITFFNPEAVILWGRTPVLGEELWCGSYRMYTLDGKWVPHDQCPAAVAMKEERSLKAEAMVERPDGIMRQVLAYPQPLKNAEGVIIGLVNAVVDITERKMVEQRKDEFMALVSHELKSPLTTIKGYSQIMKKRLVVSGDGKLLELADKMESQISKLSGLIDSFLSSAKTESGQMEFTPQIFEWSELMAEVMESLQLTTESHQLIEGDAVNISLFADRDRVCQVLINLLTNAIKYSPDANKVLISSYTADNKIVCCVQDFGLGISESRIARVFEKFYRVDEKRSVQLPGVGLGLYISSEIIRQQGGEIWVESKVGEGSKFFFSLPAVEE